MDRQVFASGQLWTAFRVATVLVPVATYFCVLGLLNSRRHPQILSGRGDFALLVAALGPMLAVPALSYLGLSLLSAIGVAGLLVLAAAALGPRGHCWVIYNLPIHQARGAVRQAAASVGLALRADGPPPSAASGPFVRIRTFGPLRNVTVELHRGDAEVARRLEAALGRKVSTIRSPSCPMAAAMLLVATAMLALPLALVVGRAPEIVRLLTDLLQ